MTHGMYSDEQLERIFVDIGRTKENVAAGMAQKKQDTMESKINQLRGRLGIAGGDGDNPSDNIEDELKRLDEEIARVQAGKGRPVEKKEAEETAATSSTDDKNINEVLASMGAESDADANAKSADLSESNIILLGTSTYPLYRAYVGFCWDDKRNRGTCAYRIAAENGDTIISGTKSADGSQRELLDVAVNRLFYEVDDCKLTGEVIIYMPSEYAEILLAHPAMRTPEPKSIKANISEKCDVLLYVAREDVTELAQESKAAKDLLTQSIKY